MNPFKWLNNKLSNFVFKPTKIDVVEPAVAAFIKDPNAGSFVIKKTPLLYKSLSTLDELAKARNKHGQDANFLRSHRISKQWSVMNDPKHGLGLAYRVNKKSAILARLNTDGEILFIV